MGASLHTSMPPYHSAVFLPAGLFSEGFLLLTLTSSSLQEELSSLPWPHWLPGWSPPWPASVRWHQVYPWNSKSSSPAQNGFPSSAALCWWSGLSVSCYLLTCACKWRLGVKKLKSAHGLLLHTFLTSSENILFLFTQLRSNLSSALSLTSWAVGNLIDSPSKFFQGPASPSAHCEY